MKYIVTMNGKKYEVEVERMSVFRMLTREEIASGVSISVQPVTAPAPKAATLTSTAVAPTPAPKAAATPAPTAAPTAEAAPGGTPVTSPMPGSVLGAKVSVSDKASVGQTMLILEATKMENETVTPVDGTVVSTNVKTGDTVDTDQIMGMSS